MQRKIVTATAFLLLLAVFSSGQAPGDLIFSRITKKDGLASNSTFHTVRDKKGYLWIATQNGLQRFDGTRFLNFRHRPGDSSSIAQNIISHLYMDKKNRLWLLFDNKIGTFNTNNFTFREAKVQSAVGIVRKIVEDQGRIILFADNKQYLFDESTASFNSEYRLPPLPAGYSVGDVAIDSASGLYWFTGKQGSLLYNPKTKSYHSKQLHEKRSAARDSLMNVKNARYPFIAKDGSWWMVNWIPFTASPPALYRYEAKADRLTRYEKIREYKSSDTYYEIWNIFQQSNGTIWIYGMGLFAYYHPGEQRFIHVKSDPFQENGIDYDFVSNLNEDEEKNVWVCTNKGLYRFNVHAQVFRNIPNRRIDDSAIAQKGVSAIVETRNDGIWVSTWGSGIFSYNNQLQPIPNGLVTADPLNKQLHASCMIERKNGEIVIGTQTGDIKIYDPAQRRQFSVVHSQLKGETITQLLEDRATNIWIGTTSGRLIKCSGGNWADTSRGFVAVLSDIGDIMNFYEDRKSRLWISTATNGVHIVDTQTGKLLRHYTGDGGKNDGLLNNGAADVLEYNDSIYLIASDGLCLLNNRTNTFSYLTASDGLPAERITNLILDRQKRLWVALDAGLYRLNLDNNLHISYDAADGITNDVFQVSSGTVFRDGRIAIGTPKDFLVFDPEQTVDRNNPPRVHITGFSTGAKALSVDSLEKLDELVLPYDNTFVTLNLSTLHFRDQYYMYYMLDGLDKSWKPVVNNQIVYQFLPPGKYTLRLKSQNGEGIESKEITTLRINVTPPFWKSWWFYSLLALLLAVLLFWFDHERIRRKTTILKMRSDIADDLHVDISAALGNITILSEMAKLKADREPEKSKEFIDQIQSKSRNMSLAMDDILWSINPSNDSMTNLMLRFTEYLDALKREYGVDIKSEIDSRAQRLQLVMNIRNDVFWLFKHLITRIVAAGGTSCVVNIGYEKPNLLYSIEFDSTHANMGELDGIAESSELSERLDEINGRVLFSHQQTGGRCELVIPLRKEIV